MTDGNAGGLEFSGAVEPVLQFHLSVAVDYTVFHVCSFSSLDVTVQIMILHMLHV